MDRFWTTLKILLIIYVQVFGQKVANCPKECTCKFLEEFVSCSGYHLNALPEGINPEVNMKKKNLVNEVITTSAIFTPKT